MYTKQIVHIMPTVYLVMVLSFILSFPDEVVVNGLNDILRSFLVPLNIYFSPPDLMEWVITGRVLGG